MSTSQFQVLDFQLNELMRRTESLKNRANVEPDTYQHELDAIAEQISSILVELHALTQRDSNGQPQYVTSLIEDIDERKKTEHALTKSLRILSTAEKVANMGSWEFDLQTNMISRSNELCRIIGVAENSQAASLTRIVDMVNPEDKDRYAALLNDAIQNRNAFECKYRFIRPDKREIVLSVRGEPIQNENGEVIRLVGSTQDITDQEERDRVLAQRGRMSALIADVGISITRDTSLKQTLKRCSEAAVHWLEAALVRIWTINKEMATLELQSSAGMSTLHLPLKAITLPEESDHSAGPFRSARRRKAITVPVHSDQVAG